MNRSKFLGGLAALCAGLALTAAQATDMKRTPALDKLIKAAQVEGELNILWGSALGGAKGVSAIQAAMKRTYGIDVKLNYTPGPSMPRMASRTIQEVKAGQTASSDIYLGIEVAIPGMVKAGVLEKVDWQSYFPYITPEMVVADGRAVLMTTLFNGILYNTQIIPADKVPQTMNDVFRPAWKGKVASTPYAVVFDRLAIAKGYNVIKPVVQKTAEWAGGLIRCGEYERIATGEFAMLFLDCGRVDEKFLVKNGGPLAHATLDDALATTLWYFAIPKTSAHPALAKLFSGFVVSKEGQRISDKYGNATSHLVQDTEAYKTVQAAQKRGVKLLSLTPDDLMPRAAELIKYKKEFQKILRKK